VEGNLFSSLTVSTGEMDAGGEAWAFSEHERVRLILKPAVQVLW
jgi:hypothetical protein